MPPLGLDEEAGLDEVIAALPSSDGHITDGADPLADNQLRASFAEVYAERVSNAQESAETIIGDFLGDLMQLSDGLDVAFDYFVDRAGYHYERDQRRAVNIEILHERDSDGGCDIRVWVDGVEVKTFQEETIDLGRGHTREDWETSMALVADPDHNLTPAFRAAALAAYWTDRRRRRLLRRGQGREGREPAVRRHRTPVGRSHLRVRHLMARYRVTERQVITYTWDVDSEDYDDVQSLQDALAGLNGSRTAPAPSSWSPT